MTITQWIEKIQTSDEPTKNRVIMITSGILIVIVIAMWWGFMDAKIQSFSKPAQTEETESSAGFSFFETLSGGASAVGSAVMHALAQIPYKIITPKEYTVSPSH